MKFLVEKVREYYPVVLLTILAVVIAGLNYEPGTWLSGWDTLHPEFNFPLNIRRSIFAVWQEYQGLGLLGGMGHASDLPRQLFLWLVSVVLPANFLRYFWVFLMWLVGPLGVYFLMRETVLKGKDSRVADLGAFLGGVFYLLNLATVQMFFVPFEAFTTHFGFLPWLLLSVVRYVRRPSAGAMGILVGLHLLASSQAYVPTVFIVYLLVLILWGLGELVVRQTLFNWKRWLAVGVGIFVASAYWLLPFGYFVVRSAQTPVEAYTNQLFTENTYLQNRVYGGWQDVLLLKNFWFDYVEVDSEGVFQPLLTDWSSHLDKPFVGFLGWLLVGLVLIGLARLILSRNPFKWSVVFLFVFVLFMLGLKTAPFSWFNEWMRQVVPLFDQVFRAPFTKMAVLGAMVWAVLFGVGVVWIVEIFRDKILWRWLVGFSLLSMLLAYSWPNFQGKAFFDRITVRIPEEYFELMAFFDEPEHRGRIANFPQHSVVGWRYYNWGFVGSGFEWYGLSQPLLDRAFDVWSRANENYYWEVSRAIYSEDAELLGSVLDKYDVRWVTVDESISTTGSPRLLYTDRLKSMLEGMPSVNFSWQFGSTSLYEVSNGNSFVLAMSGLPVVAPVYERTDRDQAFVDFGNYISGSGDMDVYYPFRSSFFWDEQYQYSVDVQGADLVFSSSVPEELRKRFVLGEAYSNSVGFEAASGEGLSMSFDGEKVRVVVPKVSEINLGLADFSSNPRSCNEFNTGEYSLEHVEMDGKDILEFSSLSSSNCVVILLPELAQRRAYLVVVESGHVRGKPMLFRVRNLTSDKVDAETQLPRTGELTTSYFILPPSNNFGLGYELSFDNISIGDVETVNRLGRVTIYPIPLRYLESLRFDLVPTSTSSLPKANAQVLTVEHPNESVYIVQGERMKVGQTLVLSQAFDDGWLAFERKGRLNFDRLDNHVLVNNWANGWRIPKVQKVQEVQEVQNGEVEIVIFYLPQLLEFLGFGILVFGALWLIFNIRREE